MLETFPVNIPKFDIAEQIFRNIYKLFSSVLCNIKYLLVLSHSGGYPLTFKVAYSVSSAYYDNSAIDLSQIYYFIKFFILLVFQKICK